MMKTKNLHKKENIKQQITTTKQRLVRLQGEKEAVELDIEWQEQALRELVTALEDCELSSSAESEEEEEAHTGFEYKDGTPIRVGDKVLFENKCTGILKGASEGKVVGLTRNDTALHVLATSPEGVSGLTWRSPKRISLKPEKRKQYKVRVVAGRK